MTVMCHALFILSGRHSPTLVITVPLVYYGANHYARRVIVSGAGEEPDRALFVEIRFVLLAGVWLATYLLAEKLNLQEFE